ncbi:MAG: GNAT family N-acetyltransferase [Methyloligellaceae bacterium]
MSACFAMISVFRNDPGLRQQVHDIFFESSVRQDFESDADRIGFRNLWLDPYIQHYPHEIFIYEQPQGDVLGYLTGCSDSNAAAEIFSGPDFLRTIDFVYETYPAHLHINVRAECRNKGIGADLIEHYASHCRQLGLAGVHIVTARGARNTKFYNRLNFEQVHEFTTNGKTLVVLGRKLG